MWRGAPSFTVKGAPGRMGARLESFGSRIRQLNGSNLVKTRNMRSVWVAEWSREALSVAGDRDALVGMEHQARLHMVNSPTEKGITSRN